MSFRPGPGLGLPCGKRSLDADDVLDGMLKIRAQAIALSPEYVAWLDGDGSDPEPYLPPGVRERMRALVEQMERELAG